MIKAEKIKLKEKEELDEYILLHPEDIEEGLVVVDRQLRVRVGNSYGAIDVLFHDSEGAFVICENKVVKDDEMLFQAFDYLVDVSENITEYARKYSQFNIDISVPVRMILVAPEFSDVLINCCKYLDFDILLIKFTAQEIEIESKKHKTINFDEVYIPSISEPLAPSPTIERHIDYITNPRVREIHSELIENVKSIDDEIICYPVKYTINFRTSRGVFCAIKSKRNAFNMWINLEGEWNKIKDINEDSDMDEVLAKIKESYITKGKNEQL